MRQKDPSNAELLKFIKENVTTKDDLIGFATKEDLRAFATKEDLRVGLQATERQINNRLDGIAKQLTDLKTENAAHQAAHQRFEHRDQVFAGKLGVNLDHVDAEG